MALVVMPFVKPHANGVAITENPFRADFDGVFINVQLGSKRVTDNCEGETPEQILIYNDEIPTPEIISTSSLTKGNLILEHEVLVRKFFPTLRRLHKTFAMPRDKLPDGTQKRKWNSSKSPFETHNTCTAHSKPAVDVEFLILNNSTKDLCVVQARPYAVHYYA